MRFRTAGGALVLSAAVLAGCGTSHPFVASGDQKSVQVDYYGDIAAAVPLARQHCGQYQRRATLAYSGDGIAVFDCLPP